MNKNSGHSDLTDVSMMFDISVVDPFVVSCDHSSVEFMVICPCNHPANSISYCRDFSAANYSLMISFLLDNRLANASAILFS